MDSSRNIVLVLLVVAIALAVFYMMDPTFAGLLGHKSMDGFQNATTTNPQVPTPTAPATQPVAPQQGPASVTGMDTTMYSGGGADDTQKVLAAAIENEKAIREAKKSMETTMGAAAPQMPQAPQGVAAAGPTSAVEGFQSLQPESSPFPESDAPANCYPKNQLAPQDLLPMDPNSKWAQVNPMGQGDISGKNFLSAGALVGVNTVGQSLRNANQQLRSEPACPQMQVSIWNQSTIEPDLQRRPLEGF